MHARGRGSRRLRLAALARVDHVRLADFADRIVVLEQGRIAFDTEAVASEQGISPAEARPQALTFYNNINK